MLKITPREAEAMRRLIEDLCANYDEDGNCILFNDDKHAAEPKP